MPIRLYTDDQSVTAEAAAVMREAYNAALAAIETQNITGISTAVIARKIASAVFDGEMDSSRIVESILSGLLPKE